LSRENSQQPHQRWRVDPERSV